MRLQNQRLLLNLIWCERVISRAEIARRTGLSRSTVSDIVNSLLETGLVSFRGAGDSKGGRRPIMLGFEDDALSLVGVDIGASHVSVAITNLRGKLLTWVSEPHPVRDDPAGTLALTERLIAQAQAATPTPTLDIVGVGVGVPSPVDPARPGTLSARVLPAWQGHSIPARLGKTLGRPVYVDNDANLGALAERWWGAGTDGADLAYIKVGTGVGSGHIVRGRIYRGAGGVAGEIGHLAIDPQGPPCKCGQDGCLVMLIGAEALVDQARVALDAGRESRLDVADLSLTAIVAAARAEDALAVEIIAGAGRHLGVATASLLNLLNPATVVFGGGLTAAGDVLMEPLRATVRARTQWLSQDGADLVASELGEREVAIGAATLVLQEALADPTLFPKVAG